MSIVVVVVLILGAVLFVVALVGYLVALELLVRAQQELIDDYRRYGCKPGQPPLDVAELSFIDPPPIPEWLRPLADAAAIDDWVTVGAILAEWADDDA